MKKATSTPKAKAPTIAEEREKIEKTGLLQIAHWMIVDENTLRIMPAVLKSALRPMNKAEDYVVIPPLGIAVPACYLLKFAPLMGDGPAVFTVDRSTMILTITYRSTPDSRSRTTIKGIDALEFEPAEDGTTRPEFFARLTDQVVTEPAKIDTWLNKAVSKDEARPNMQKPYGKFGADGYRLHYNRALPVTLPPEDFCSPDLPQRAEQVLYAASHVENAALIPVAAFMAAMKQVRKANKSRACLYVNGRMDISTTSERDDQSVIRALVENGYQHSGENVKFDIDPRYVIDALSGMTGEDVVIGISDVTENGGRTLYISDGAREAVIMSKGE